MDTPMSYLVAVTYEDGYWLAEGTDPSFATFARTLTTLRDHVADALALAEECDRIDRGEPDPHVDRTSIDCRF